MPTTFMITHYQNLVLMSYLAEDMKNGVVQFSCIEHLYCAGQSSVTMYSVDLGEHVLITGPHLLSNMEAIDLPDSILEKFAE